MWVSFNTGVSSCHRFPNDKDNNDRNLLLRFHHFNAHTHQGIRIHTPISTSLKYPKPAAVLLFGLGERCAMYFLFSVSPLGPSVQSRASAPWARLPSAELEVSFYFCVLFLVQHRELRFYLWGWFSLLMLWYFCLSVWSVVVCVALASRSDRSYLLLIPKKTRKKNKNKARWFI